MVINVRKTMIFFAYNYHAKYIHFIVFAKNGITLALLVRFTIIKQSQDIFRITCIKL